MNHQNPYPLRPLAAAVSAALGTAAAAPALAQEEGDKFIEEMIRSEDARNFRLWLIREVPAMPPARPVCPQLQTFLSPDRHRTSLRGDAPRGGWKARTRP